MRAMEERMANCCKLIFYKLIRCCCCCSFYFEILFFKLKIDIKREEGETKGETRWIRRSVYGFFTTTIKGEREKKRKIYKISFFNCAK
jgi:hypothetical protein